MLWGFLPTHWWKSWGPLASASFLSLSLLLIGDSLQLAVVRGLRNTVLYPATAIDLSLRGLFTVRAENEELRRELTQARLARSRYADLEKENVRLRTLLDLRESSPDTLIPAKVVGRGGAPRGDWGYLTVRSVVPSMLDTYELVAITPEGLAGHVVEREMRSLVVASLASSRSSVHVVDQRSNVAGVVRAVDGVGSRFRMDHVPVQEDVAIGDTLITSGHGRVFPRGIPVGAVAEIDSVGDALLQQVWVEPFVRFSRLEELYLTPGQKRGR